MKNQYIRDPQSDKIKKLKIGDVVFSYAFLVRPRPENDFKPGTYGADLIIQSEETLEYIEEYIKEVIQEGKDDKWDGKISKKLHIPLREGDPEIEAEEGKYVLKTSTKRQPRILIKDPETGMAHDISEDEVDEIYSGMIGEAVIVLAPYNYNGQKGISCYLNAVAKTEDGEAFGTSVSYEDLFSDGTEFDDEEEEEVTPAKKSAGKKSSKKKNKVEKPDEDPEDDEEEDVDLDSLIKNKGTSSNKSDKKDSKSSNKKGKLSISDLIDN